MSVKSSVWHVVIAVNMLAIHVTYITCTFQKASGIKHPWGVILASKRILDIEEFEI